MIRYYLGRVLCAIGWHDVQEVTEIESRLYRYHACRRCMAWFTTLRRDE